MVAINFGMGSDPIPKLDFSSGRRAMAFRLNFGMGSDPIPKLIAAQGSRTADTVGGRSWLLANFVGVPWGCARSGITSSARTAR